MKTRIICLCSLLVAPLILRGEVKYGGYLSFEYRKGQTQSGFKQGSFQDLQGGLFFSGNFDANFKFILELGLRTESKLEMEQALAGCRIGSAGDLNLGLFLVPFGKYNRTRRPYQQSLIRTPLNIEACYPESWRDIGLCFEGQQKGLNYAAYIGNGLAEKDGAVAGQQFKDLNKNKGWGGRIGLVLGEGFEAGMSYSTGKYDQDDKLALKLMGADLTWVTTDYEVRGEYTKGRWKNPSGVADGKADGFFVLLAFNYGTLHPIVSFQRWNPGDTSIGLPLRIVREGPEFLVARSRWAFGARYALSQTLMIKAEYDLNKEKGLAVKNDSFQIQAALSF